VDATMLRHRASVAVQFKSSLSVTIRRATVIAALIATAGCEPRGESLNSQPPPPETSTQSRSADHPAPEAREQTAQQPDSQKTHSIFASAPSTGRLTDVSSVIGIQHPAQQYADGTYQTPEITPGGIAVFDFDDDGDLDIYQVRHAPPGSFDTPEPNLLYEQTSDGRFVVVPDAAGLNDEGFGHGVAIDTAAGLLKDLDHIFAHHPDAELRQDFHGCVVKRIHLFFVEQFERFIGRCYIAPRQLGDPPAGPVGLTASCSASFFPCHHSVFQLQR